MKLEYTELPTMLDVAQAQERGEAVECRDPDIGWNPWNGARWSSSLHYRSVREVPVKKMKFLGWLDSGPEIRRLREDSRVPYSCDWTRFPAADQEYEVEE